MTDLFPFFPFLCHSKEIWPSARKILCTCTSITDLLHASSWISSRVLHPHPLYYRLDLHITRNEQLFSVEITQALCEGPVDRFNPKLYFIASKQFIRYEDGLKLTNVRSSKNGAFSSMNVLLLSFAPSQVVQSRTSSCKMSNKDKTLLPFQ